MIQPGLAACAIGAIVAVYILSVLMTIRMVNAKGRKWGGLRLIIYVYPLLGLLVAMLIPARRQGEASSEPFSASASDVKLLWRCAPKPSRSLGRIEVEIARPSEHTEPTIDEVARRLRQAAADKGANAVAEVDFIRSRPRLWTIKPRHVLAARGLAVILPPDIHATAVSDAEAAAQVIDADPREALKEQLMAAGGASIFWAILNAAAAYDISQHLEPGLELDVVRFVIYILSPWMFVEGLMLLCVQHPLLLIPDGFTVIAVGIVNILIGLPPLGIFQVVYGAISLSSFLHFTWRIRKYDQNLVTLSQVRSKGEVYPAPEPPSA